MWLRALGALRLLVCSNQVRNVEGVGVRLEPSERVRGVGGRGPSHAGQMHGKLMIKEESDD
jgi:hypothetical protein